MSGVEQVSGGAVDREAAAPEAAPRWEQGHLGGGGFITGLVLDPFDPRRLYARCDVAGAFVSDDEGASWVTRNAGLTRQHHHQVAGLVPSPHVPGLVLRCSGDTRQGRAYGSIHRSTDHGRTWTEVNRRADFYGNGPLRAYGEVISFDPFEPTRVLVAAYSSGIYASDNAGLTWERVTGNGRRHSVVLHHPRVPGLVYAGTAGDVMLTSPYSPTLTAREQVLEHGDIERGSDAVLYRSGDGGRTWERAASLADNGFTCFDVGTAGSRDGLVLAGSAKGLYRSTDYGTTFTPCTIGYPHGTQCDVVRSDPHRPGRYLAATYLGRERFPLYESLDHGLSWHLLIAPDRVRLEHYPAYVDDVARLGEMLPTIVFHPDEPNTFFITGWWGVSRTTDGGRTFSGQGFNGLETTCVESVVTDHGDPDRVYLTVADHAPWTSDDGGRTFVPFPPTDRASTGLAVSPGEDGSPTVVFGTGSLRLHDGGTALWRSDDAGATQRMLHRSAGRRFVQSVEADPHSGDFWVYVDGDAPARGDGVDRGPGLYLLSGEDLEFKGFPVPLGAHLPQEEAWLESELLPIVVYQKRNAQGCNHMLACDPFVAGRLYVGEPTRGLWRSDDAGTSWFPISAGLPFGERRTSTFVHVRCHPSVPDRLYAGFLAEGLWRSDDAGASWAPLLTPSTTGRDAVNSTGMAFHPHDPEILAVPEEPMWWTNTTTAVWLSQDGGSTWRDVHDPANGALRVKQAAFDGVGRLHLATIGNGVFRCTPEELGLAPGDHARP